MKKVVLIIILFFMFIINVKAGSDATLKSVKFNNKDIECIEYICESEIDANNVIISFETTDPLATIEGRVSGTSSPLTSGVNRFYVNVISEDRINKILYEFAITKHIKSEDKSLSKLIVDDNEITLKDSVFVYSTTVPYDLDLIKVEATTTDKLAKLSSPLEFEFDLESSSITIEFTVTAEDTTIQKYRVFITRENRPNTSINHLIIKDVDLIFKKDIYSYDIEIPYDVNVLEITPTLEDENATFEIKDNKELKVGDNVVTIEVKNLTAISTYTFNVKRLPNLDPSLANLDTLVVRDYTFDFDPNIFEYDLEYKSIPDILDVEATPIDETAKVSITGNDELKDKSIVSVKVTLDNGVSRIYKLNIFKLNSEYESDINLYLIGGIATGIIVIIVMIILISKKRKRKNNKSKTTINNTLKSDLIEDIEII